MNKENKKLAQERKAQERAKAASKKRIKDALWLLVPIVLIVAVVIFMIWAIATSGASDSEVDAEGTELDWTFTDEDGNEVEISDWTEVDEDDEDFDEESDTLDTTEGLVVEEGDTVNIDYVGTVDGVAFEGGDTEGMGADLTIGSDEYIDGFEDAIIGHTVGETFDLTVTFPENYGVDE